jgi:hypothetical protein
MQGPHQLPSLVQFLEKNSFFQIIICFQKAVKEIHLSILMKFVAKIYANDNFFCASES